MMVMIGLGVEMILAWGWLRREGTSMRYSFPDQAERILEFLRGCPQQAATIAQIAAGLELSYDRTQHYCRYLWSEDGRLKRDWQGGRFWYTPRKKADE